MKTVINPGLFQKLRTNEPTNKWRRHPNKELNARNKKITNKQINAHVACVATSFNITVTRDVLVLYLAFVFIFPRDPGVPPYQPPSLP